MQNSPQHVRIYYNLPNAHVNTSVKTTTKIIICIRRSQREHSQKPFTSNAFKKYLFPTQILYT